MTDKLTPRQARLLAGYSTMSEIATDMEMPVSTYANKENGKTAFSIKEGMLFADLCNRHFSDIDFLWTDRPESGTDEEKENVNGTV